MKKPRVHLWLEVIINFLYFIFVSPFRFRYDDSTKTYKIITSLPHKILPIIIHTLGILSTFLGIYTYFLRIPYSNPRCMFHSVVVYSRYVIYYALLFCFWTKRQHFCTFFTHKPATCSENIGSASLLGVKVFVWLLCFIMIFFAILIEIINYGHVTADFSRYIISSFGRRGGPKNLETLLGISPGEKASTPSSSTGLPVPSPPSVFQNDSAVIIIPSIPPDMLVTLSTFEYWFTLVYSIISVYVHVCNHAALLFCNLAGITMHQAASSLISAVENDKDQDKVINKYIEFCKFGGCLNEVCGCVILGTILCSPPFFIVYLIGTFTTFETAGPRVIFYSCMYCVLYAIASEAASKASEFKEWIIEYGEDDHESQLFAIFVEVSENPMGLRGMGCFTITYGFVAKMFALIISFTIILLQFETTPPSPMTNPQCQ